MLMVDICGRRRPGPKSPEDREPEPDEATAWKYCKGEVVNLPFSLFC
jgi:hypothetical protein